VIVLLVLCGLVAFVASIFIIVKAFQVSPLWGLAVLFIPFANLVFIAKYWAYTRVPALVMIFAFIAVWVVFLASDDGAQPLPQAPVAVSEPAGRSQSSADEEPGGLVDEAPQAQSTEPLREAPLRDNARREVRETQDGFPVIVTTLGAGEDLDPELQELTTEQILARLDQLSTRRIRVVYEDGQVSEGLLRREGEWLVISRQAQGGLFERKIRLSDIEGLQVVR
jgi:hypothetical protein